MANNADNNTLQILLAAAELVQPQAISETSPDGSDTSYVSDRVTPGEKTPAQRAYPTPSH